MENKKQLIKEIQEKTDYVSEVMFTIEPYLDTEEFQEFCNAKAIIETLVLESLQRIRAK